MITHRTQSLSKTILIIHLAPTHREDILPVGWLPAYGNRWHLNRLIQVVVGVGGDGRIVELGKALVKLHNDHDAAGEENSVADELGWIPEDPGSRLRPVTHGEQKVKLE